MKTHAIAMKARFSTRRVQAGAIALAMAICLGGCASSPGGYGAGDAAAAQAEQQQALAKQDKPDSAAVYLALVEQMQQKDMYFASLAHLDQYERLYGVSSKTTLMRADALRATDQLAASATSYRALIGSAYTAQGYRGLGLIAGAQGDFNAASQSLAKAAEANPTDPQTLNDLAYALMHAGDVNDARVPIMKAAELDQKSPKIMCNLAVFLLAQGQTKNANGLMDAQNLSRDARDAVRKDAQAVAVAVRARDKRESGSVRPAAASKDRAVADVPPVAAPGDIASVSSVSSVSARPIDPIFPGQQWRSGPALAPFPVAQAVRRATAE